MFDRLFRGRGGQGGRGGGGQGRGIGRGGGNKPGSGPGGYCVCPNPQCGHRESHAVGERCVDRICPKCGTKMVRE